MEESFYLNTTVMFFLNVLKELTFELSEKKFPDASGDIIIKAGELKQILLKGKTIVEFTGQRLKAGKVVNDVPGIIRFDIEEHDLVIIVKVKFFLVGPDAERFFQLLLNKLGNYYSDITKQLNTKKLLAKQSSSNREKVQDNLPHLSLQIASLEARTQKLEELSKKSRVENEEPERDNLPLFWKVGQDKPKHKSKPWDDTLLKLEKLREIRTEGKNKKEIPKWTYACNRAGITPRIAKKHDPELRKNWYDLTY